MHIVTVRTLADDLAALREEVRSGRLHESRSTEQSHTEPNPRVTTSKNKVGSLQIRMSHASREIDAQEAA